MTLQEENIGVLIGQMLRKGSPVAQYTLALESRKIDVVRLVPNLKLQLLVKESWNKTQCA